MSEKIAAQRGLEPRTLTAAEIRCRVEEIAEDLAHRMRNGSNGHQAAGTTLCEGFEAYPLDNLTFIRLMSDFIHMN